MKVLFGQINLRMFDAWTRSNLDQSKILDDVDNTDNALSISALFMPNLVCLQMN